MGVVAVGVVTMPVVTMPVVTIPVVTIGVVASGYGGAMLIMKTCSMNRMNISKLSNKPVVKGWSVVVSGRVSGRWAVVVDGFTVVPPDSGHCVVSICFVDESLKYDHLKYLPSKFRKAGRVWCGGARETHWATFL